MASASWLSVPSPISIAASSPSSAWTGPTPSPALPDVKTAAQQGVPEFRAASWNALYARTGTPPEILSTLNKALHEVLADPDMKKRLLDLGIDSKASTPAEMDVQMRDDIKKWAHVSQGTNFDDYVAPAA